MATSSKTIVDMPCKSEATLIASNLRRTRAPKWPSYMLTLSLCLLAWGLSAHFELRLPTGLFRYTPSAGNADVSGGNDFRWGDITPTRTLRYTPCWHSFQCARLSVPMNWNDTDRDGENGPRAAVAIIKLPARVPVTDARYGGPVILNPGGPGESGIYQVLSDGQHLQTIVDSQIDPDEITAGDMRTGRYFDILSFDPRGVNNTTPPLKCFPDVFNQQSWLLRFPDIGLLWDSESIVGFERARASAMGASCSSGGVGEHVLPYLSTPQVVEDIVEIIEKEGQWRSDEAQRLIGPSNSHKEDFGEEMKLDALQRTAHRPGHEKLQYWGMSYGTVGNFYFIRTLDVAFFPCYKVCVRAFRDLHGLVSCLLKPESYRLVSCVRRDADSRFHRRLALHLRPCTPTKWRGSFSTGTWTQPNITAVDLRSLYKMQTKSLPSTALIASLLAQKSVHYSVQHRQKPSRTGSRPL